MKRCPFLLHTRRYQALGRWIASCLTVEQLDRCERLTNEWFAGDEVRLRLMTLNAQLKRMDLQLDEDRAGLVRQALDFHYPLVHLSHP